MAPLSPVALQDLHVARQTAVAHSVDPISLKDLRTHSDQVVALVDKLGCRVEAGLHHRASSSNLEVSPVTSEPIAGCTSVPPLKDLRSFLDFVDWDADGVVSGTDVGLAFAAILPVDADGMDRFLHHYGFIDQDGSVTVEELEENLIAYWGHRFGELRLEARVKEPIQLRRESTNEELLDWFARWAKQVTSMETGADAAAEMEFDQLRFAIMRELYQAMGRDVDVQAKETVVGAFFQTVGLTGQGRVTSKEFLERYAPALVSNLPDQAIVDQISSKRRGKQRIQVVVHVPVSGQVVTLFEGNELPAVGGTVAHLCEAAKAVFEGGSSTWEFYLGGQQLGIGAFADTTELQDIPALHEGATVQALPILSLSSTPALSRMLSGSRSAEQWTVDSGTPMARKPSVAHRRQLSIPTHR